LTRTDLELVAGDGERHLPALDPESVNHYRHLTAYHFALRFAQGRRILDYGCGTGYGANLVLRKGDPAAVCALDVGAETVTYCVRNYPGFAGRTVQVAPGLVPLRSGSVDLVLLFQTIEHVADDVGLLRELGRVLAPDGRVLITTPNVAFSGGDPDHPLNPFHLREYDTARLMRVCRAAFSDVEPLYVHSSLRSGGGGFGPERSIVFRAVRKALRLFAPRPLYVPPVSLGDFRVTARGEARALDLLFVCRLPNGALAYEVRK
jgi:SAM-dependent methyltransferase